MSISIILQICSVLDITCDAVLLFGDFLAPVSTYRVVNHSVSLAEIVSSVKFGTGLQSLRVFYTIAASAISLFVGKLTYAYVAHKDPSKRFDPCHELQQSFLQSGIWAFAGLTCLVWKLLPLLLMRIFLLGLLFASIWKKNGEKIMYRLSHTIDMFEVLQMSDFVLSGIPLFWISAIEIYRFGILVDGTYIMMEDFWFTIRLVKVATCFLSSMSVLSFTFYNVLGFSGRGFGQRRRRYDSDFSLERDNCTSQSSILRAPRAHEDNQHRKNSNGTLTWSDQEDEGIVRTQIIPKQPTQWDHEIHETILENEPLVI